MSARFFYLTDCSGKHARRIKICVPGKNNAMEKKYASQKKYLKMFAFWNVMVSRMMMMMKTSTNIFKLITELILGLGR